MNAEPNEFKKFVDDIYNQLTYNPILDKRTEVDWDEWKEERIGYLLYFAYTRIKLESGKDLFTDELGILADRAGQTVSLWIKDGKVKATKNNKYQWIIPNQEVLRIIKERDLDIYNNII